jgi:hypothetical protein
MLNKFSASQPSIERVVHYKTNRKETAMLFVLTFVLLGLTVFAAMQMKVNPDRTVKIAVMIASSPYTLCLPVLLLIFMAANSYLSVGFGSHLVGVDKVTYEGIFVFLGTTALYIALVESTID